MTMTAKVQNTKTVSFFEFWPGWIMYAPVFLQWMFLALRYQSLTLPFLANPSLKLAGMVGVAKTDLMKQATGKAKEVILPWIHHEVDDRSANEQATICLKKAKDKQIELPLVCKPDIGCRGVGVKLVETQNQLENIIARYPVGATLICQKLASYEDEVGIFFVKDPQTGVVEMPSMTIKVLPRVTGDGVQTVGQLIEHDSRAGQLKFLYHERHKDKWGHIPAAGEDIRLVFSASHSKGAIFTNACEHVTPALMKAIDEIMQGFPDFYYGRLDVKFSNLESLKSGENLELIEVNGASAESIHIWDKDTKFFDAIKALLWQYSTLYRIGAYHRSQGKKPPTLTEFLQGWQTERRLTRHYPPTD